MYLYGASGHGKVVAEIAERLGIDVDGFIDEDPSIRKVFDLPVLRKVPPNVGELFISVGDNRARKQIVKEVGKRHYQILIHPQSIISRRVQMEPGTVVMAGVSINSGVEIGKQCILNTNCSVDHDCQIGDYVHVSPNVALAGNVSVGEGTNIGIGACVIQGIKIGKWAVIGAGAVVIHDIPDNVVVVGNPAKIIKQNHPSDNS